MVKPDFTGVDRRVDWTDARVAYVRHLAEGHNKSAREIALDIGLSEDQTPRIFAVCRRHDIALTGQAGRPKTSGNPRSYNVGVHGRNADLLDRLAKRHSLYPGKVAEILLNASFEQGEPFCENMLDLGE